MEETSGETTARAAASWPVALLVAAILLALLLPMAAPGPAESAYPSNFRRHQEKYWVFYAPRSWGAASGKNDLQISSPTGTLWNYYGAGGMICPRTAASWFQLLRNRFRNTSGAGNGLYSHPMRGAHFTRIGRIRKMPAATYGPAYFRQKVLWAGRRRGNNQAIKGELIMDAFAIDSTGTVCGQRFQARGAPARGNARSIRLLRLVQTTITQRNL